MTTSDEERAYQEQLQASLDPTPRIDHGWPHYYNCTVPGCTVEGHKCYKKDCTDPVHTHPVE